MTDYKILNKLTG